MGGTRQPNLTLTLSLNITPPMRSNFIQRGAAGCHLVLQLKLLKWKPKVPSWGTSMALPNYCQLRLGYVLVQDFFNFFFIYYALNKTIQQAILIQGNQKEKKENYNHRHTVALYHSKILKIEHRWTVLIAFLLVLCWIVQKLFSSSL